MGGGYPAEQMDMRSRWISGREITLDFPRGAVLCAYIDGLVERHDQSIGIAQLGAAVSTAEPRLFVGIGDGRHGPLQPAHGRQRADPSQPAGNRTPPDRGVAWRVGTPK